VHGENERPYVTQRQEATSNRTTCPTTAELIELSRARVGYKAPDEVIELAEMPLNAVGKVDRVALTERAAAMVKQHLK